MKLLLLLVSILPSHAYAAHPAVDQLRPGRHGSDKNMRCPIKIVPGTSIGPIQLGRHRDQIAKLGLKMVPVRALPGSEIVGRYSVSFDEQGLVRGVKLSLEDAPECVRYQGHAIPKKTSAEALAKILPGCGERKPGIGGSITVCQKVQIGSHGAWGGVTIRLYREEPAIYLPPEKLERALIPFYPKPRVQ